MPICPTYYHNTGYLTGCKTLSKTLLPCIITLSQVQELVALGSLINYLQDTSTHPRPGLITLKLWAAEIANGMTFLEGKRFVHRDLAARNILVASLKQASVLCAPCLVIHRLKSLGENQ